MKLFQLLSLLFTGMAVQAQMAITNDGTEAHPSAMLHIKSTTRGLLLPRLTSTQRNAIAAPANGLMVYDTDLGATFFFRQGTGWVQMITNASSTTNAWSTTGNAGLSSTNFLGTLDNTPLIFKVNNTLAGYLSSRAIYLGTNAGKNYDFTGSDPTNIGIGVSANENAKGIQNIAIGSFSLQNSVAGMNENIALGNDAMRNATAGSYNIAIGNNTLQNINTTGAEHNIALGERSLTQLNGGTGNIGIGRRALFRANNVNNNIAIGDSALAFNETGNRNTAVGSKAAYKLTGSSEIVAFGYEAMQNASGGNENTAVGYQALWTNSGNRNTAIGYKALATNTIGTQNTLVGLNALSLNTTGSNNTVVGTEILTTATNANGNVGIGYRVLKFISGSANVGIGNRLLEEYTSGDSLVAVGSQLAHLRSGAGSKLVLVGSNMLTLNEQAVLRTIGVGVGQMNTASAGSDNVLVGFNNFNTNTQLNNVVAIGVNLGSTSAIVENVVMLGNDITGVHNNAVYLGNSSTTRWLLGRESNNVGFALQVGTNALNGNGAGLTAGGIWTNACDSSLKTDITTLNRVALLEKIANLPITRWRYKGTNEYHIGPMAQDFKAIFNVGVDDKSISAIDPGGIALAAIQQLLIDNNIIKERIEELKSANRNKYK
ncbi:MAG: tail fiber domain-containing protein [Chitinophagaceae bacterium]|jgi:hypothetical protein|nr:tail fiber domain-containing protein [Chitinophagaceae bacterium]